jgi:hypothetical protein
MKPLKRYLLDPNILIEAHQRYYPIELVPGFWQALIDHHEERRVFSIEQVKQEIKEGKDELWQWAKEKAPKTFFKQTADRQVTVWYGKIMEWVSEQSQFKDAAKEQFASGADGWLIAYAKSNKLVVVTHEGHSAEAKRTVPIPIVCEEFEVAFTNTFDMLRDLGVQLVLGRPRK